MTEHDEDDPHSNFSVGHQDPLLDRLHAIIRQAVRALSVLMVLVILWGIADVVWVLYQKLSAPPVMLLGIGDIFAIFGAFLVVLISIEIFVNISLYLRDDVIHVKLVVATALMAIARKVIVLDYNTVEPAYVYATAATVLALGITYWLVSKKART